MLDGFAAGRRAVALIGLLAVAGCGWAEWPPRDAGPTPASRPPPAAPAAPAKGARVFTGADAVVAGPGDSVHGLARRHGVSARAIIDANRLLPPYRLRPGQRIVLPRRRLHRVRRGDTLHRISRLYGTDTYALARANRLGPPYTIYPGQTLVVPGRGLVMAPAKTPTAGAQAPAASKRRPPRAKAPPPPAVVPRPPAVSGKGFIWPVEGPVISSYGAKAKGLHNDGINIAAPRGSPVRAAENGVVAYAGNELRGFGNLVLIKHAGGWITAYAHNADLLVERGRTVKKGETIATVGDTGSVTRPQLHFELRRGRRAVDPRKHLAGSRA